MRTLRRIIPWLFVVIAIGVVYDGWIFYSRWNSGHEVQAQQQRREIERAKHTAELVGGDEVKILSFAAEKGSLHRGEHTTLCYGVNAAAKVRIEPEIPGVYPAMSHCLDIAPVRTTEYRLVAEDKSGKQVEAALIVKVR